MIESQSESAWPGTTLCSCPIHWAGLINQATTGLLPLLRLRGAKGVENPPLRIRGARGVMKLDQGFAEGKRTMPGPGMMSIIVVAQFIGQA